MLIALQPRVNHANEALRLARLAIRMQALVMVGDAELAVPSVWTLFVRAFAFRD